MARRSSGARPAPPSGRRASIAPVRWQPPAPPERSRRQSSDPTIRVEIIAVPGHGTEDVLLDAEGRLYTGLADGRILRLPADLSGSTVVADTGGRPLGLELHPDGGLLVCDAERGLLRLWPDTGVLQELLTSIDGVPMRFCNNAAVGRDGTVYFTDSSTRFGVTDYRGDLLEHGGTGRLFRLDPDGTLTLLADGLQFPNGVALAADESFLVFAQTSAYSLQRLWLRGSDAGRREPFVENLPGFPDNVSLGSDGLFWVALPSTRNRMLDRLAAMPALLRRLAWTLPDRLQPHENRTVFTQAFDRNGVLVRDLQQPNNTFYLCSGVRERGGVVYLGSLVCAAIGRVVLEAAEVDAESLR